MADVQPFSSWMPEPALASEVAALPYDVFSRSEAAAEIAAHPRSFLRIDKSCALLPELDEYDPRVYELAAELLIADKQADVYRFADTSSYYLYSLEREGHKQTGIVATVATDDYRSGAVRRHENTREKKRSDRIHHIEALKAQTGPVFLTYRPEEHIDELVAQWMETDTPLLRFTAPDGVQHSVWHITDLAVEQALTQAFSAVGTLYIADGHHRAAAAVEVGSPRFLAILFPSDQLRILDYNRVVVGLNGLDAPGLLKRLSESFVVGPPSNTPLRPAKRGSFGMYLAGSWHALTVREELRPDDSVMGLDVALLHDLLIAPILGIADPRSDPRISYVGGARGLEELAHRLDALPGPKLPGAQKDTQDVAGTEGGGVAFALYPCTLDELFAVADAGCLMPPKSTWFEPKPRSGLFIYPL